MADLVDFAIYAAAALACALAALWVWRARDPGRMDRVASAVALGLSALWCLLHAAIEGGAAATQIAGVLRNLAWIVVLYRTFADDGRDQTLWAVRPLVAALVFVGLLQVPLALVDGVQPLAVAALLAALQAVGALVLVHNLYAGAGPGQRRMIAWSAGAMALFWVSELNYHTVAWLGARFSGELAGLRGLVMLLVAFASSIGFAASAPELRLRPSRAVAFQLLSLAGIGVYLAGMLFLAQWMGRAAGGLAQITQIGFLLAAAGLALLWLPSRRLRAWLRVVVLKHLFRHRYDYRSEWIRFTHTIGRSNDDGRGLPERAIQSLGDIADSPAGLLLVPDEDGALALEARWRWPLVDVPSPAAPLELARILERESVILDFDEAREGISHCGELASIPAWLTGEGRAWAGVPLLHRGRLIGLVVLARPDVTRRLDWEDFDLLGIAGQQVASYLAERAGHRALEEAERFDEFNRRMAFVMHDIKNLSSQMGLLARNAERHAENPAFRKDMLVTLRSSTDKLNALLARLGRYGGAGGRSQERLDLTQLARTVADRMRPAHDILCTDAGPCAVLVDRERLEQSLVHLVQNAVDASEPGLAVTIAIRSTGLNAVAEISDSGCGMSARFVRNELFKPFASTKDGGFGIGALEARDAIRAMGGRLDVDSREGLGSRFTIILPLADTLRLGAAHASDNARDQAA